MHWTTWAEQGTWAKQDCTLSDRKQPFRHSFARQPRTALEKRYADTEATQWLLAVLPTVLTLSVLTKARCGSPTSVWLSLARYNSLREQTSNGETHRRLNAKEVGAGLKPLQKHIIVKRLLAPWIHAKLLQRSLRHGWEMQWLTMERRDRSVSGGPSLLLVQKSKP